MQNLLAAASNTIDLTPQGDFASIGRLDFPGIIAILVRFMVIIAAVIFFFMLVIGGIRWIASGGDKGQTEAARSQITAALVGLVIVLAAWAIAALIHSFFGVDILHLNVTIPAP